MSLQTGFSGILVAERLSGHKGRVRRGVATTPSNGVAGQQGCVGAHYGFCLTAAIATAITAN